MDERNQRPLAVPDGLKIGVAIGSVFIPLLGIIMGIIYLTDNNPEKKAAGKLWLAIGIGMTVLGCVCAVVFGFLGVILEAL